jgi:hypothetical protein
MDLFGSAKKVKKATEAKKTKSSTKKTSDSKKTKKTSTTTRSKSKTKGGNFLGAVGDLVAPTGWGPFATAAGLLALDRADAALRRGTKEKKEKMKGGKKMKGGNCENLPAHQSFITTKGITENYNNYMILNNPASNLHKNRNLFLKESKLENPLIKIICENDVYNLELMGTCGNDTFKYKNDQKAFMSTNFEELKNFISNRQNQLRFIRSCLKSPQLQGKCVSSNS